MSKTNIFEIEIDPESELASKILQYGQLFNTSNKLQLNAISDLDYNTNNIGYNLSIPYGETTIVYIKNYDFNSDTNYEKLKKIQSDTIIDNKCNQKLNEKLKNINISTIEKTKIEQIKKDIKEQLKKDLFDDFKKELFEEHLIKFNYQRIKNTMISILGNKIIFSEILTISSPSGKELLLDFCKEAIRYYNSNISKNCIPCYILHDTYWDRTNDILKRDINTIYLDDHKLEHIINDIDNFFNNKDKYHRLGIPYKRNYLLCGSSGTGKTSLVRALASKYNKKLAYLYFSIDLTDDKFIHAINHLPNNCFLLLEDFDSLFIHRNNNEQKCNISFSSILNILDGVLTNNNQITFITTNHIDKLDSTLKRASRIDYILKFPHITKNQIIKMYNKYFPEDGRCNDFVNKIKKYYKYKYKNNFTLAVLQLFFNRYIDVSDNIDIFDKIDELENIINEFTNNSAIQTNSLYV